MLSDDQAGWSDEQVRASSVKMLKRTQKWLAMVKDNDYRMGSSQLQGLMGIVDEVKCLAGDDDIKSHNPGIHVISLCLMKFDVNIRKI